MYQKTEKKNEKKIVFLISTLAAIALGITLILLIPTQTVLTSIPETQEDREINEALGIAQTFIVTSPTFAYDGDINTLDTELVEMIEDSPKSYLVKMAFESAHSGYGNREGQILPQINTHHQMEIIVSEGDVISAVTDQTWDELNHQYVLKQQKLQSSNSPLPEFNGKVNDLNSFVMALKSRGVAVDLKEEIDDSSFSVPIKVFSVGGADIQVYEFVSELEMKKSQETVSRDGTQIGTSVIRWIDDPHFFSQGKIIVQYIGHNPEIMKLLDFYSGKQFAGF